MPRSPDGGQAHPGKLKHFVRADMPAVAGRLAVGALVVCSFPVLSGLVAQGGCCQEGCSLTTGLWEGGSQYSGAGRPWSFPSIHGHCVLHTTAINRC